MLVLYPAPPTHTRKKKIDFRVIHASRKGGKEAAKENFVFADYFNHIVKKMNNVMLDEWICLYFNDYLDNIIVLVLNIFMETIPKKTIIIIQYEVIMTNIFFLINK